MLILVHLAAASVITSQPPPAPVADWQTLASAYFSDHLKDPASVAAKVVRQPRYGAVGSWPNGEWTGWAVCYSVNARNSYGGYTGAKPFVLVFDDKGLVKALDPESERGRWRRDIDHECAISGGQPTGDAI